MSRLPLEQGRLRGCEFRHFLNAFRRVILDIVHRRTGPEIVSSIPASMDTKPVDRRDVFPFWNIH